MGKRNVLEELPSSYTPQTEVDVFRLDFYEVCGMQLQSESYDRRSRNGSRLVFTATVKNQAPAVHLSPVDTSMPIVTIEKIDQVSLLQLMCRFPAMGE